LQSTANRSSLFNWRSTAAPAPTAPFPSSFFSQTRAAASSSKTHEQQQEGRPSTPASTDPHSSRRSSSSLHICCSPQQPPATPGESHNSSRVPPPQNRFPHLHRPAFRGSRPTGQSAFSWPHTPLIFLCEHRASPSQKPAADPPSQTEPATSLIWLTPAASPTAGATTRRGDLNVAAARQDQADRPLPAATPFRLQICHHGVTLVHSRSCNCCVRFLFVAGLCR